MDLKNFIKETISSINGAVKELQENRISNEEINPVNVRKAGRVMTDDGDISLSEIEFNVVLSDEESKSGKKGIGVWLASIGGGLQESNDSNIKSATSIKFSIPISYPVRKD